MRSLRITQLLILLALTLTAIVGVSAQDNDRDRRDRDRNNQQMNQQRGERWRVRRNGRYYELQQNQADMLRQAVNAGYQQGYQAGRDSRTNHRRTRYQTMTVYREGTYGYSSGVDQNLYQYYFQQGFQRGYQDGYSSRFRYGRDNGGTVTVLDNILNSIVRLQRY